MNLLLLHEADRCGPRRFRVAGLRARHLLRVLGVTVGARVRVGLLEGAIGEAEVTALRAEDVELVADLDGPPPPRPVRDLVLAVPRPKMLRRLLPQIAALGVDRLVLLRTWRVQKPYLTARILTPDAYRPLLFEGLSQARCTREPRVTVEPLFRPFAEDRAAALAEGAVAFVAHPGAGAPPSADAVRTAPRSVLAIGPEGGFLPFEVDLLGQAGFRPVTLGPRTLRTDTACVALLAHLAWLRGVAPAVTQEETDGPGADCGRLSP